MDETTIAGLIAPTIMRYSCMHPKLRQGFYEAARELKMMPLQELVISENVYITEESIMHMTGKGTPAATLAIPRRYSHTPIELLNINDAVKTTELLIQFVKQNGSIDLSFF